MTFITQGKTNWKYIIIVVILALIVGGGALWYSQKKESSAPNFSISKEISEQKALELANNVLQQKCGISFTEIEKLDWNPGSQLDALSTICSGIENYKEKKIWLARQFMDKPDQVYAMIAYVGLDGKFICVDAEFQGPGRAQFKPMTIDSFCKKDETADWKTYRNEEYGFELKYPENFGANVWRPHFWPPTVTVVSINEDPVKKGCPDFPVGIQGATESKVKINNIDYSFYRGSEGAAGSSYTSYCYVTEKNQNYYVLYFVIRSATGCGSNCGAYCGTQYEAECENLDRIKDIEKPIENILSTFRFIE